MGSAPLEYVDEAVRRSGDRSPHEDDVLLAIHTGDHEILDRERLAAHAARQALALDDARRVGRRTDRARLATHRRAVRRRAGGEPVALDHAREAAALGRAEDVDVLALLEYRRHVECLAERVGGHIAEAELAQVPGHRQVALLELPQHRLRVPAFLVRAESQLQRAVAVALAGADVRDGARSRLDHGHRDDVALLVEELRHAELLSDHAHHEVQVLSRSRTLVPAREAGPAPSLPPARRAGTLSATS